MFTAVSPSGKIFTFHRLTVNLKSTQLLTVYGRPLLSLLLRLNSVLLRHVICNIAGFINLLK